MLFKENIQEIYPLSPGQEGMLFHSLLEPTSPASFVQASFTIQGSIDRDGVDKSLDQLVRRHDVLRTVFVHRTTERPTQVVLKERPIRHHFEDIRDRDDKERYIREFKERDRENAFVLAKDALMRVHILQWEDMGYEFIWSYHHILMDGWSVGILINEFFLLYSAFMENRSHELPPVHPYKNYISWLERRDKAASAAYWSGYVSGFRDVTHIGQTRAEPAGTGYSKGQFNDHICASETRELRDLTARLGVTLNTALQAVWGVLLAKYTDKKDALFGTVVSGRPPELAGVAKMVGLFINTIPVRVRYEEGMEFATLLQQLQDDAIRTGPHQYFPLPDIPSGGHTSDLIRSLFGFESFPGSEEPDLAVSRGGVSEEGHYRVSGSESFGQTTYDLNMIISPSDVLNIEVIYNSKIYDEEFIRNMVQSFRDILLQVVADPSIMIGQVSLVLNRHQRSGSGWETNVRTPYPDDKTIQQLFEKQVERSAGAVAVICNDIPYTYANINERANRLARYLRDAVEISPDDRIGILAERSIMTLVGMLAILKAGAAYVPIDPLYPEDRMRFIATDAGFRALLAYDTLPEGVVRDFDGLIISLDESPAYEAYDSSNLKPVNGARDLAYVMYTSGSSGSPKGVMIEHRSVARLLFNTNYVDITASDQLLQLCNLCFDPSIFEIWGMLLHGGVLHFLPFDQLMNPDAVKKVLASHPVTMVCCTASWFKRLVDTDVNLFGTMRAIIVGGERLPVAPVKKVKEAFPGLTVINGYGPTENTTLSTCHIIKVPVRDPIPIGKPIANSTAYVLDEHLRMLPTGAIGQICVGGDGLARGYIGRPELNESCFVPNPYETGSLLYLTGDLGKYLSDGSIEFLGRKDQQLKIRGYRIEPGEIESALSTHPRISTVHVVSVPGDGTADSRLAAFYTADVVIPAGELKTLLSRRLPDHMIPSHFQQIEKFSLTPNGKTDLAALPILLRQSSRATAGSPPLSFIERVLASVWEKVLERHAIGVHDNFFEIGGHSIKAMRIISQLYREFNLKMDIRDIFLAPTIAELSGRISFSKYEAYSEIARTAGGSVYPVSPSQRRLWLLDQFAELRMAYTIRRSYFLLGELDVDAFNRAFYTIVSRHEILRTVFTVVDGVPVQKVMDLASCGFQSEYLDISSRADKGQAAEKMVHDEGATFFDLEKGPLFRVKLVFLSPGRHLFLLTMHHIVSDGWSMQVLFNEITLLYDAYRRGLPDPLPALDLQYKDYAAWYNKLLTGERLNKYRTYWKRQLGGTLPRLALPTDFTRPAVKTSNGQTIDFALDEAMTKGLYEMANFGNASLYMVLVAVINVLFYKYTGQTDIILGCPIAGRDHKSLENQIGFYVNTLALRTRFSETDNFLSLLDNVKETTLQAYEHQHYPFEQLVEELNVARDISRTPIFDVKVQLLPVDGSNGGDKGNPEGQAIVMENMEVAMDRSQFDLSIDLNPVDKLYCSIEYNTDLFKKATILLMKERLIALIRCILEDPARPIGALDAVIGIETPFAHLKPEFDL